jgi:ComF family protein
LRRAGFDNFGPVTAVARRGRVVARRVLDGARLLLPQSCALCGAPSRNRLLCGDCHAALPWLGPACPRCALPVADGVSDALTCPGLRPGADRYPGEGNAGAQCDGPKACMTCRRHPPGWSSAVAAWRYEYPVDRLLQGLKYGGRLALAEPLADALHDAVASGREAPPDVLVPLPLAPARQRVRGFNQAQLVAARLSRRLGTPVVQGLDRVRDAGPQAALPLSRRADNVRDAFRGRRCVAGLRVALVDDVLTTGATLAAATGAALAAGARDVRVYVVARTLPPEAT